MPLSRLPFSIAIAIDHELLPRPPSRALTCADSSNK
jgi:hypothetical protein